jgi:hypothetical protein
LSNLFIPKIDCSTKAEELAIKYDQTIDPAAHTETGKKNIEN